MMEFWGVEVKSGEKVKVNPGSGNVLHISQAALGEMKKDKQKEPVYMYLNADNQKFVIGTLRHDKFPQMTMEVLLDKVSELSHSCKNGSVFFTGYKVDRRDPDDMFDSDNESEEELPHVSNNEVSEKLSKQPRSAIAKLDAGPKQVNFNEQDAKQALGNGDGDDDDEEDDEDISSSEESEEEKNPKIKDENESDESSGDEEDDDGDESSDEETLKKTQPSKKRPAESAAKAPSADKKAKFVTPEKTDGKKAGGRPATPYPSKQAGKKPVATEQSTQQTPKTSGSEAGSYPCKSCGRSFTTEGGLQSHTKAKHGAAA